MRKQIAQTESATLSVDEAHAIIGTNQISRASLYAALKRKEVPHLKLGSRILIPRQAFLKWLASAGQPQQAA